MTIILILLALVAAFLALCLAWRWASRRWSIPYPALSGWMLDNPPGILRLRADGPFRAEFRLEEFTATLGEILSAVAGSRRRTRQPAQSQGRNWGPIHTQTPD